MRTMSLVVGGAAAALGLAACTAAGTPAAAPSGTPSAAQSGTATGGSLAGSCVAGNWRGTGMNTSFDAGNGAKGTASGGSGVEVAISPDGRTVIDFSRMQPINFQADVGGNAFKGQFTYGGKVTGAVQVSSATASTGTWKPVGPSDWSNLIVSVEVTSPIQTKIDNVKVSDYVNSNGGQSAGSVDAEPILREASFSCSGDGLTIGPPPGSTVGGTWLLTRA
jgi:hypothetical protein